MRNNNDTYPQVDDNQREILELRLHNAELYAKLESSNGELLKKSAELERKVDSINSSVESMGESMRAKIDTIHAILTAHFRSPSDVLSTRSRNVLVLSDAELNQCDERETQRIYHKIARPTLPQMVDYYLSVGPVNVKECVRKFNACRKQGCATCGGFKSAFNQYKFVHDNMQARFAEKKDCNAHCGDDGMCVNIGIYMRRHFNDMSYRVFQALVTKNRKPNPAAAPLP
eukprot:CFRG7755T1